jgi:cobalt/nickel transport system ATP-binding protein
MLIEARELSYSYPDGTPALRGVSLGAEPGEKIAVIGANGSGKSTLLTLLSGCVAPVSGDILLNGVPTKPDALRRASGMVFQEPDDQLFMPSVLEDVAFGLVSGGMDSASAKREALSRLDSLGASHLASRPPHRMSGGEKRLAALAGVLVMRRELLLLDEPTSSLDPRARREMAGILRDIGETMIIATHDLDLARAVCGRAFILERGEVRASGGAGLLGGEERLREWGL